MNTPPHTRRRGAATLAVSLCHLPRQRLRRAHDARSAPWRGAPVRVRRRASRGVQTCNSTGRELEICACDLARDGGLDVTLARDVADATPDATSDAAPDVAPDATADVARVTGGLVADLARADGFTRCGRCVDTTFDPSNCGGCGRQCAAGQWCNGGRVRGRVRGVARALRRPLRRHHRESHPLRRMRPCVREGRGLRHRAPRPACALDLTRCGDACTSLATDPLNCGACGRSCGPGGYRDASAVTPTRCRWRCGSSIPSRSRRSRAYARCRLSRHLTAERRRCIRSRPRSPASPSRAVTRSRTTRGSPSTSRASPARPRRGRSACLRRARCEAASARASRRATSRCSPRRRARRSTTASR